MNKRNSETIYQSRF